ncbi:rhomboid domain-containing protein 3 [Eublepharis macularius]|uniref:Rhomboid domain-containing protein 3 n=1 Tax=Eublepharis macularius TaxID=481883 RepID=A0AA97LEH9_EUBMA|nr:rhomboid domain-containing protein 3 [Eublepharis macularius]XP_054852165.1 rhomboid domain-containing protein 3 [Eublepharis macularius]XP_054852166.1 rhomboid domain-containing protein 3 [Eublepharis macularius]
MRLRRLLTRLWELQHPPIASSILMLLLCLFWLMGIGDNLALVPSQVFRHSQILFAAYRLVIYCLYHTDATHLLFNLLLFPLLGWAQELRLGTCRYLYVSLLGAVIPALLYILLAVLYDTQFDTAVGGYTPVHLAMLGYHQRQEKQRGILGVILAALVASLLLGLCQILSPNSPFLLHSCGLLTCLAFCAGIFSPLELPERSPEMLHNGIIYRTQARGSCFLPFVMPPATGLLPTVDPAASTERIPSALEIKIQPVVPRTFHTQPLPPTSPSVSYWGGENIGLEQESRPPYTSGSPPSFSGPYGASDIPFPVPHESLLDEEMLQAGIQASLQDVTDGELKLSKSSVSSLRLQQLQKMGFPTEQAVVALAATGRVEGAVSLLIGGHIGDAAVVTTESQLAHHELLGTSQ